jgi:hypothetical protein
LAEEDRRSPDQAATRQRELDAQVEELTQRIADVINGAGDENRQDLREYALGLLKEQTEQSDASSAPSSLTSAQPFSPLPFAILLFLVSLPLVLLFPPLGGGLLVAALLMGAWGLAAILLRRS